MPKVMQTISDGWEAILRRDLGEAERLFSEATKADPKAADGWNGIGAVHFEKGELEQSLKSYERALKSAKKAAGGKLPARLSWDDDGKPTLRAVHGIGLNRFRMGDLNEAVEAFEQLLALNPDDNQGVRFLLQDAKKKRSLWKK